MLEFATLNGRTVAWDALAEQSVTAFGHGLFAARDLLDQLVAQLQSQYDVRIDPAAVSQAQTR